VVYPEKRQVEWREGHGEGVGVDQPSRLSMVDGVALVRITFVGGRGCSSMLQSVGSVESGYP
jgi:hypothetical protein